MLTKTEFIKSLREIGLKKGDTVFIQSDLFRVGLIENAKNPNDICDFYFETIMEYIGDKGTISVLTFFGDYGKGIPYDRQKSP